MDFRVHTEYSLPTNSTSMAIIATDHMGNRSFVQKFTLKTFPDHVAVPREEAFCLEGDFGGNDVRSFLQAMMDAGWEMGLRPKQAKDQKDELAAVRYHLEDMRQLAILRAPIINS